jgi:tripartite-type tricarboxylate transporter receptor subunit TctC
MEVSNWFGIVAPKGTPAGVVLKLNQAVNRALADPEVQDKIVSQGNEVGGGDADSFARFVAAESQRWGGLIREKNIKPD